ncbi:MAG: 50S ribosomal protein L9 [Clostridia bacterium]|nr:50S ribosomal protein L9 [Clostridia bacterium]MDD4386251.1 50S ribosomal protein L9 [Clostridia bacterium]
MKVILNQDIKGVGKKFQTVEVSEGYARNFLLPKKLANMVDNKNSNEAKNKLESIKFKKNTELEKANEDKRKIEKKYIEFKHKVGENGKLFGSVTEKEISTEIKNEFDIIVDKKKIILKDNIKEIGSYIASVKLYEGVVAKLKINVVRM